MISKLLAIASCVATLAVGDVLPAKAKKDCSGSSACLDEVKGVAGHVAMNVKKNGRRLQETGFAEDSSAKKAVSSAIESKCGANCKSKVHTYESERPGEATASERRLLSATGIVDVNYTVDCNDTTECHTIWAALNGVQPADLTTAVTAELQSGNVTEYTVEVKNHLVDRVPCAIFGMAYNDPFRNEYLNGAVVATAYECQQKCSNTLFCTYFSWYKDSGGCWLQGNYSKLSIAGGKAEQYAISGPASCTSLPDWATMPTIAMKQLEGGGDVSADAAVAMKQDMQKDWAPAMDVLGAEGPLGAAPANEGGGFNWIPVAGGVAAVALVGGAGAYFAMGSGKKDKSKKKTRGLKAKKGMSQSVEEVASLTAQSMPAVEMPQMPAYSTAQPAQYQYQPSYPYPQPQYYTGSMQPMPMAQPMQYTPAAEPQYGYYMP